MNINLSQSLFQDTFFVAGAQLTPYRRLRQIELELRAINDLLKKSEFSERRSNLKMSKLDKNIPEESIELEELEWERESTQQLIVDCKLRKANFEELKDQLIKSVPKEYWDAGFENAELEYWTTYVSKQISMAKAIGVAPSQNIIEMWLQLPQDAQFDALVLSNRDAITLQAMDKKALSYANPQKT